jgi:hypothetical protein
MTNETLSDVIKAVKDHALDNYNHGGWDYLVECWEDEEIASEIRPGDTAEQAIRRIGKILKTLDDYRAEIRATEF